MSGATSYQSQARDEVRNDDHRLDRNVRVDECIL